MKVTCVIILWYCSLFLSLSLYSQSFTISGYVRDSLTGETLVGANLYLSESPNIGVSTNNYGYFSLQIPAGRHLLVCSYLGYQDQKKALLVTADIQVNMYLLSGVALQEILVTAKEKDENVKGAQMGKVELSVDQLKKIPALLGEADILKALQLLPGVRSAGEGNAGFYVRGGGADQNLILLDEAVVYNSGHLLGFFSIFNADAIKNATLIKGGMPANYGSRLSSVVDVQMKEGNDQHLQIDGGIGAISSRLTVQGPLQKEKCSFILSARRTYALDLAQPFIRNTNYAGTNYFFYDLNAKVNYRFGDQDRLFFSTYFGRDVLRFRSSVRDFYFNLPYGNGTATLRWNHLFTRKLFVNSSLIYNDYDFRFGGGQADLAVEVFSGVRDWNLKFDFDYFPGGNHRLKYGANYTYHRLTPNIANARSGDQTFSNNLTPRYAQEGALYFLDDLKLGTRFQINAGLRLSWFTQMGPYVSNILGRNYTAREAVKTYFGPEPRLLLRYEFQPNASLKMGVTTTKQYIHLVSNSSSTLPADIWVPSSEKIKPQLGIQYALGYFRNFNHNKFEASVEGYFKSLWHQIDYRENYVNNPANNLENEFVFGKGRAYGLELLIRKNEGRLNGWVGYALSRTERKFPDVNQGKVFPAVFDRRHDLSIVANYRLSERWSFTGVFVFGSGRAFTPIQSLFFIGQTLNQEFGPRNSARLKDYHRLDFSATYTPLKNKKRHFVSSWVFSVYNTYSRQNPFFVYYDLQTNPAQGTAKATAVQVSLFPIIPSVTWNFSWRGKNWLKEKH